MREWALQAEAGFSSDQILKICIQRAWNSKLFGGGVGFDDKCFGIYDFTQGIYVPHINFTILSHLPVANLKNGSSTKSSNPSDKDFGEGIVVMFRHRKLPGGEEIWNKTKQTIQSIFVKFLERKSNGGKRQNILSYENSIVILVSMIDMIRVKITGTFQVDTLSKSRLQMSIWSKAAVCVSFEECQYAETDIGWYCPPSLYPFIHYIIWILREALMKQAPHAEGCTSDQMLRNLYIIINQSLNKWNPPTIEE